MFIFLCVQWWTKTCYILVWVGSFAVEVWGITMPIILNASCFSGLGCPTASKLSSLKMACLTKKVVQRFAEPTLNFNRSWPELGLNEGILNPLVPTKGCLGKKLPSYQHRHFLHKDMKTKRLSNLYSENPLYTEISLHIETNPKVICW